MEVYKVKKLLFIQKILLSTLIKFRYLKIHLNVDFEELIGDFIKDESGNWWLINIKGYVFKPESIQVINWKLIAHYGDDIGIPVKKKVDFQNIEYQKCKLCKYCEISFP